MHHCGRYIPRPVTRRQMLLQTAGGFGAVAAAALMGDRASGAAAPFTPKPSHYTGKARNVIFLFMEGGVSQVDTFDPKPMLDRDNGKPFAMKMEPTQFNNNGSTLASPWKFRRYGQSGLPVSDLFPHIGQCADELAVVRSMTSEFSEHAAGNYFLHTGFGIQGRPSMGAWAAYGLGSECNELPGFIVLNSGKMPIGGPDAFGSGFLPATFQGSIFSTGAEPISNIKPLEATAALQQSKLEAMRALERGVAERFHHADALESSIANYELAFRMQAAVPGLMDLGRETAATRTMYGLDSPVEGTRLFGENCLKARRLIERGVRFIEVTMPQCPGEPDTWDAHQNLRTNHETNARAVDQPIGALLKDLRRRGLLDETLVVWAGEFGRTPFAQGAEGRDHNPYAQSIWMAGGGVRAGSVFGETDEYGYKAVRDRVDIHDLHATMLHLLGLDHRHLTYRWGGRDMRLTDVSGELITGILA
jgi:hypothetical protein